MTKEQIQTKITDLKSLKLPLLNKKSRAYIDWKTELDRLTKLLNVTK